LPHFVCHPAEKKKRKRREEKRKKEEWNEERTIHSGNERLRYSLYKAFAGPKGGEEKEKKRKERKEESFVERKILMREVRRKGKEEKREKISQAKKKLLP